VKTTLTAKENKTFILENNKEIKKSQVAKTSLQYYHKTFGIHS